MAPAGVSTVGATVAPVIVKCAKEGCKNTTNIDPNDPSHDYKLATGWDLTTDDLQLSVIDLTRGDVRVQFWCPADQPPGAPHNQ